MSLILFIKLMIVIYKFPKIISQIQSYPTQFTQPLYMSLPLNINCNDFEACKFFQQARDQIRRIAQQNNLKKSIAKTLSKVQSMKTNKTQQLDKMMLKNIIIDFLRSEKYDYTYPVFMRECNVISEQIVSKKKLSALIGVQQQLSFDQRFNVSLIQLMVKKLTKSNSQKSLLVNSQVQVQLINKVGIENNNILIDNKIKEIRQEVQDRERKYYQKKLESIRSRQIMELRSEVAKQLQTKYKKQQQKIHKNFQQIVQKVKSSANSGKLKEDNQNLLNKNFQLTQQLSKIKVQIENLKKQKITHDCCKSQDYIKLKQIVKQQRKQLQEKKKQLDYALRNINTKVEDLILQKRKLQNQKQSDVFLNQARINKQNKDYMIQTIFSEMKQMQSRVKVLSEENAKFRQNIRTLQLKVKQKQQLYGKIQSQLNNNLFQNDINKKNRKPSSTIQIPQRDTYKSGTNSDSSKISKIKCFECLNRKQNIKPQTINICIGVKQEDLIVEKQIEIEQQSQGQQLQLDQFENKTLGHNKKLAKLRADMNLIKKNVLRFVDNQFNI